MATRVLIVDDDLDSREALGMVFAGETCELVPNATAALESLSRRPFDVVISDARMDGMSGLELLDRVKGMKPSLPFIVITAFGALRDAVDAVKRGAFQYVTKPCSVEELRSIVGEAVGDRPRETDRAPPSAVASAAPADLGLIGLGQSMRLLERLIELVATSSAPVLVTGETGVGKELVARAIHARSGRRDRPFVAVNTSAVQEDLFESELFGHARGAFTGAAQARKGLLTEAHGGTLLLDEIGDMPMGMQSKLLRVLQFGEVRPVGSDRAHQVDVRVIAATHRDLPALVHSGDFREDLYFRLNVLPIVVPPLRERREDIPELALHFLAAARERTAHSLVRSIDDDALRALTGAPWPGNVRELASAIERAVVFCDGAILARRHLSGVASAEPPEDRMWPCTPREPWTLHRLSHAYAEWVLRQTGGDKHRAAELLGINLSTLYRWGRASRD